MKIFLLLWIFMSSTTLLADDKCVVPMTVKAQNKKGFKGVLVRWMDHRCQAREAFLINNDGKDPKGKYGGYIREYSYIQKGKRRLLSSSHGSYPGFGFIVSHYLNANGSGSGNQASISAWVKGTWKSISMGKHHYIHEYHWVMNIGGEIVPVTVHWYFQTARSHPIFSISYDMSHLQKNAVRADTRSPYGNIYWDVSGKYRVDGVEWGDKYVFKTTSEPLNLDAQWDYSEGNQVPYVMVYSRKADAMQASILTQLWEEQDAGGYWFARNWGKKSENRICEVANKTGTGCASGKDPHVMPEEWNWAYQTVNYQLKSSTNSKRFAWGTNFGAVGLENYLDMSGQKRKGWPEQSYSVITVFDTLSSDELKRIKTKVLGKQSIKLQVKGGSLLTDGFDGVVKKEKIKLKPAGYDHRYGVWRIKADSTSKIDISVQYKAIQAHQLDTLVIESWPHDLSNTKLSLTSSDSKNVSDRMALSYQKNDQELWITIPQGLRHGDHIIVEGLH